MENCYTTSDFQKKCNNNFVPIYCPKKNKFVTLQSTMHNDKGTGSPRENKPEII